MAKPHVENLNAHGVVPVPWRAPGLAGGASVRVLAEDPVTRAMTGVVEFPRGFESADSVRTAVDLQMFVLEGTVALGEHALAPGGYCWHPAGGTMGRLRIPEAARVLMIVGGPVEFTPSRETRPAPQAIPCLDSFALQWVDPLQASDPSSPFRTGVCVKVLRVDPVTGASTHLAGLLPGWFMPGMETHPVYEENYCLSGDVRIADLPGHGGYTMTEGVFLCRPPGIAHGPIVSKNGNVNFIYAHGRLAIDYSEHPRAQALIDAHLRDSPWK